MAQNRPIFSTQHINYLDTKIALASNEKNISVEKDTILNRRTQKEIWDHNDLMETDETIHSIDSTDSFIHKNIDESNNSIIP